MICLILEKQNNRKINKMITDSETLILAMTTWIRVEAKKIKISANTQIMKSSYKIMKMMNERASR